MASAIVPIITAAAPLITPLIQSLVLHVEKLFGAKTGATKLSTVVTAVQPVLTNLQTAGTIPSSSSATDNETIATAITQAVVLDLKAAGILTPAVTPPTIPSSSSTAQKVTLTGTLSPA